MIKKSYYAPEAIKMVAAFVNGLLFAIFIFMPGLDFGRAFGWDGFLINAGLIVASSMASCALWSFAFLRKHRLTQKQIGVYALLALPTAMFFFYGLFSTAQADFALGEYLQQNKIEHFCLDSFKREYCVVAVNMCPACAKRIDKWKRNQMTAKLNAYAQYFPKEAKPQPAPQPQPQRAVVPAAPANRAPASVKPPAPGSVSGAASVKIKQANRN